MTSVGVSSATASAPGKRDLAKLKQACEQFESLFLNYLLQSMRSSLPGTGLTGNSQESHLMTSMFDENLAREIAGGGGIGLGRILFEQLKNKEI